MSVITWIGLGNMGLPMATLLVQAGHDVRGVEINPSVSTAAKAVGITVYPVRISQLLSQWLPPNISFDWRMLQYRNNLGDVMDR
jgi:UDP-N-acetyl-D-mannosaminuronate dehydrogenase